MPHGGSQHSVAMMLAVFLPALFWIAIGLAVQAITGWEIVAFESGSAPGFD